MKGTIRERVRADGTSVFTCQVEISRDPATKKRRFKTATASTRREASVVIHRMITEAEAAEGQPEVTTTATLGDLITEWLRLAGPAGVSTRSVYAGYIKNQVKPYVWDVRLDRLKVADMDRWYAALRESGLQPASIRKAHNIVRAALSQGVRWGWVPVNVAAQAKPPVVPKPVILTPSAAEVRDLVSMIAESGDRGLATYVRLAGVTGGRPGELCALQWGDVDFRRGDLHVRRRIVRDGGQNYPLDLTKTGKSRRIPLDATTLRWLQEHFDACTTNASMCGVSLQTESFVFASVEGTEFWRPDTISRRFRMARKKCGLPDVPLYSLRHQAATTMIDAGVDPKTASDRLGNSVATILSTYTRGRTEADLAAANVLGKVFD